MSVQEKAISKKVKINYSTHTIHRILDFVIHEWGSASINPVWIYDKEECFNRV